MNNWDDLISQLGGDVAGLAVRQFLILEYRTTAELSVPPYAQFANDGDALLCEVVSDTYLPSRALLRCSIAGRVGLPARG